MTKIHTDDFVVEVIRSKRRKTMALAVRDAAVTIRMPAKLPIHYAEDFISNKAAWIRQKLAAQTPTVARTFAANELLPYLGESLAIRHFPKAPETRVDIAAGELQIRSKSTRFSREWQSREITRWYRLQAESYLMDRCDALAARTGLNPRSVTVKSYKARWGSCHITGDIQLNWKLIMAPPAVIDYVIIHELCHLKQHNHSPAFWQLVENFDPTFTLQRAWLKKHGHELQL